LDQGRDRGRPDLGRPRLSVVIPVYNEGESIAPVVERLLAAVQLKPLEVLIVHDFEEDSTVPVVRRLQADHPELRLYRNIRGRGVLNALRAGMDTARAELILVMMGDGSDDPRDVDPMVGLAEEGCGVVAASRYMRGGRQLGGPLLKRTLSRLAGVSLYALRELPIHDPTNNFKLYRRQLLDLVTVESTGGFELALELTVKAHRLGMRVAEVPTTWRDRTSGESRFDLRRWLPRYLRWYLVALLRRPVTRQAADRRGDDRIAA
jgi:glycosyltransferase involved in cell wall biosynthesis